MKVKYAPEAGISIFVLKELPPSNAISEPGAIIVSYDESNEPISIEFLMNFLPAMEGQLV